MKKVLLLLIGAFALISVFTATVQGFEIAANDVVEPWAKAIVKISANDVVEPWGKAVVKIAADEIIEPWAKAINVEI